jgi:hypothetical protein
VWSAWEVKRIYLDEDSPHQRLIQLLRRAAHDVEIQADAGLSGKDDPSQLVYAITSGQVCLTGNHGDFMSPGSPTIHTVISG